MLAEHGLNSTRSFCYWPDFVPAPEQFLVRHILQGAAAAPMHVHVARGDGGQFQRRAQCLQRRQAPHVEAAGQQFHAYPEAPWKSFAQPTDILSAQPV